jgi:hypothetical protein
MLCGGGEGGTGVIVGTISHLERGGDASKAGACVRGLLLGSRRRRVRVRWMCTRSYFLGRGDDLLEADAGVRGLLPGARRRRVRVRQMQVCAVCFLGRGDDHAGRDDTRARSAFWVVATITRGEMILVRGLLFGSRRRFVEGGVCVRGRVSWVAAATRRRQMLECVVCFLGRGDDHVGR